jgi:hypothetical protein
MSNFSTKNVARTECGRENCKLVVIGREVWNTHYYLTRQTITPSGRPSPQNRLKFQAVYSKGFIIIFTISQHYSNLIVWKYI